jgi:hypothetical protein
MSDIYRKWMRCQTMQNAIKIWPFKAICIAPPPTLGRWQKLVLRPPAAAGGSAVLFESFELQHATCLPPKLASCSGQPNANSLGNQENIGLLGDDTARHTVCKRKRRART